MFCNSNWEIPRRIWVWSIKSAVAKGINFFISFSGEKASMIKQNSSFPSMNLLESANTYRAIHNSFCAKFIIFYFFFYYIYLPLSIIGNLLLFRMVHCVSLFLLLLFCSYPFFGLNVLLISGIKPLLCTLVWKYKEEKGLVADSMCGMTTLGKGLLLPLLDSWKNSEQLYLLWLCLNLLSSGLWISTLKSWIHFSKFSTATECGW